ncbi:hypothetical protein PILCRDRAFT_5540 [Piloderma croceum F 1598]|uniref:Uncharacterized protein n=1 Tax=Piloderma croceum (strain F 1598) TaxID=765440 RepID=A0A0C3G3M6_PILCF|nr:hypothetical protein PILCRDRAFT_5540 [Piloderma croceum F 1598]
MAANCGLHMQPSFARHYIPQVEARSPSGNPVIHSYYYTKHPGMALNASAPPVPPNASVQPSELTRRRLQSITGTIDDDATESDQDIPAIPAQQGENEVEDELSEQQLRELYDSEEIDRFLNLFSAYVTEVRLPGSSGPARRQTNESRLDVNEIMVEPKEGEPEEDDWVPIHGTPEPSRDVPTAPKAPSRYLSEHIAQHYIIPYLPPAPLPPPLFTFGRLRVTTQRLHLAVEPVYKPFFADLGQLARWESRRLSFVYCVLFWVLWWHNLLLPSLFFRVFYAIIRRRIFPYPTLQELRQRRKEVARANVFGDAVRARLTPSSPFGIQELWRIFKVFNKPKVDKAKNVMKDKGKNREGVDNARGVMPDGNGGQNPNSELGGLPAEETATVLDNSKDIKRDKDAKRAILQTVGDIADLHERIKNIAIWRRPTSSYVYSGVAFFLFLVTLFLPAKYIAKLVYAVGGIFFWHIAPIIAAMPAADRARLPPAFNDIPSDADYAMELISQRVASGLSIKPPKKPKKPQNRNVETISIQSQTEQKPVDWKKWGERAALGKAWANDGKRLFTGDEWRQTGTWPPCNPLMPEPVLLHGMPSPRVETHTFPAQHTSAPGLITLTPVTFFFTPLMSSTAKVTIAFSDLRGVKKTGLLQGLSLRWAETQDDKGTEKEERFIWVGDRDELFARLIGPNGHRWLKV